MKSGYDLKEERMESAISYAKQLEKDFKDTDTAKDAVAMRKKLEQEKISFAKLKVERNLKIAELTARQQREQKNRGSGPPGRPDQSANSEGCHYRVRPRRLCRRAH